jgi:hypothetical protein
VCLSVCLYVFMLFVCLSCYLFFNNDSEQLIIDLYFYCFFVCFVLTYFHLFIYLSLCSTEYSDILFELDKFPYNLDCTAKTATLRNSSSCSKVIYLLIYLSTLFTYLLYFQLGFANCPFKKYEKTTLSDSSSENNFNLTTIIIIISVCLLYFVALSFICVLLYVRRKRQHQSTTVKSTTNFHLLTETETEEN